jgi:hypothetical protein
MRYAKLLASTCAVAAFAATAFASVPAARKSAIEMSALAWTIPLPGYVFRAGQFTRVPQRRSLFRLPIAPGLAAK